VSIAVGLLAYEFSRTYLLDKRLDMVRREALSNARFIDGALAEEPDSVADVISDVSDPARPVLLDVDGSWYGAVVGFGDGDVPDALQAEVRSGSAATELTSWAGEPAVTVGAALPRSGAGFYQTYSLIELRSTLDAIRNSLVGAATVSTLLFAGVGLMISRRVLRPLRDATDAAGSIASGDMTTRLHGARDPDLVPLVDAFNDMADALDSRISRERRFAADISHELRTPLTALTSAVHIIDRRSGELSESGRDAVEVLHRQVEHFSQVVTDILDLSRLEAGLADVQVDSVQIDLALRAIAEELEIAPGVLQVDPSLPDRLDTDPRRLRVMVRNLVENARRYAGGCTRLAVIRHDDSWSVEVDDHGPGVPAAEREQVFERFRRGAASAAPGAPKGTGLGLALVWENARALGGDVVILDPPHPGTRVRITLPLHSRTASVDGRERALPR
jgi:signal transduction histidine kinase